MGEKHFFRVFILFSKKLVHLRAHSIAKTGSKIVFQWHWIAMGFAVWSNSAIDLRDQFLRFFDFFFGVIKWAQLIDRKEIKSDEMVAPCERNEVQPKIMRDRVNCMHQLTHVKCTVLINCFPCWAIFESSFKWFQRWRCALFHSPNAMTIAMATIYSTHSLCTKVDCFVDSPGHFVDYYFRFSTYFTSSCSSFFQGLVFLLFRYCYVYIIQINCRWFNQNYRFSFYYFFFNWREFRLRWFFTPDTNVDFSY